jgi:hypothetical protein
MAETRSISRIFKALVKIKKLAAGDHRSQMTFHFSFPSKQQSFVRQPGY